MAAHLWDGVLVFYILCPLEKTINPSSISSVIKSPGVILVIAFSVPTDASHLQSSRRLQRITNPNLTKKAQRTEWWSKPYLLHHKFQEVTDFKTQNSVCCWLSSSNDLNQKKCFKWLKNGNISINKLIIYTYL